MSHYLSKRMREIDACRHSYWYNDIAALESINVELVNALTRLRDAEKDCIALRHFDVGLEEWADVKEVKHAQIHADTILASVQCESYSQAIARIIAKA